MTPMRRIFTDGLIRVIRGLFSRENNLNPFRAEWVYGE